MPSKPKVVLFLDTNYFLHWPPPDGIDWLALCNADEVLIIIAPSVVRELNADKDGINSTPAMKERAGKRLKYLIPLIKGGAVSMIRTDVSITAIPHEPNSIDFAEKNLSKDMEDDRLLASIIEFKNAYPNEVVLLGTHDGGLQLKAPYHQIEVLELPEDKRLQDEPDENLKARRRLEEELNKIKTARPLVSLVLHDGSAEIRLSDSVPMSAKLLAEEQKQLENVQKAEEAERARKARIEERRKAQSLGIPLEILPDFYGLTTVGLSPVIGVNSDFLDEVHKHKELLSKTFKFGLRIKNEGTVPAENVEIHLQFAGEVEVDSDLPKEPKPVRDSGLLSDVDLSKLGNVMRPIQLFIGPSGKVNWKINSVKHNVPTSLGPLYITDNRSDNAERIRINYTIHADNVAEPVSGVLFIYLGSSA